MAGISRRNRRIEQLALRGLEISLTRVKGYLLRVELMVGKRTTGRGEKEYELCTQTGEKTGLETRPLGGVGWNMGVRVYRDGSWAKQCGGEGGKHPATLNLAENPKSSGK